MKSQYMIKHQTGLIAKCTSYEQLTEQLARIDIPVPPVEITPDNWKQSKKYWEDFLIKEEKSANNKQDSEPIPSSKGNEEEQPPPSYQAKSDDLNLDKIAVEIAKAKNSKNFKKILDKYNLTSSSPEEFSNVSAKGGGALRDWIADTSKTSQGQINRAEYYKKIEKNIDKIAHEGYTSPIPMDNAILRTPKELSHEAHEVIRILVRHAFESNKPITKDREKGYYAPIEQNMAYDITWGQLHMGRKHYNRKVLQKALDELMESFINIQRKNPQKNKKDGFQFCGKFQWLDAVIPTDRGIRFVFGQTFFSLMRELNSTYKDGYTRYLYAASNYGIRSDKSYMYEFFASYAGKSTQEYTKEELYKQFKIKPVKYKTIKNKDGTSEEVGIKTRYTDVKRHYLVPAIKEINKKSELNVEMIETKLPTNKKEVKFIRFKVDKKETQADKLL